VKTKELFKFQPFTFLLCLFLLISCEHQEKNKLTIATAANMQFAIDEIVNAFKSETGIECEIIVSSSGKLTAQIQEGAPFDIFISADMKYPNELYEKGLTKNKPEIYAKGNLILWTMKDDIEPSIAILETPEIKHIATANPKTAPYGIATKEVLIHYNISEKLNPKLVFGESIAQTNQFIALKAAEIGFTAKSVVLSPQMIGNGKWIEIDKNTYTPINQGITILKNGKFDIEQTKMFYNFLFSIKGKEILNKFGYEAQ